MRSESEGCELAVRSMKQSLFIHCTAMHKNDVKLTRLNTKYLRIRNGTLNFATEINDFRLVAFVVVQKTFEII